MRVLGGFDAMCVVIGAIIGVGIFFTPSRMAQLTDSGALMLLAWAIAGGIALCGALTFAELGGLRHGNGAQYQILRDSYGPLPAFLFVFCNATAIQASVIGIIAIICARHLGVAISGQPPAGHALLGMSIAIILVLSIANIIGVKWGSRIQNFTVCAKLLTLAAIIAIALAAAPASDGYFAAIVPAPAPPAGGIQPAAQALSPVQAVLAALVPALFAFGGWQQALWISGEVHQPQRNLPRAIIGGVVVVIIAYLLVNWAYLRLLGVEGVAGSSTLAADALAIVLPATGGRVAAGAVAISALGVLNAQLLSGPRLIFGMAQDGRFFSPFGRLGPRFATPVAAIALLTSMALVLLLAAGERGIDHLLTGAVFIDGIFFALTGAALIVLRGRLRRPAVDRPFRVPGYPVVPLLFVLGEIGVVVGAYLDPATWTSALFGVGWIAAAVVVYAVWFRTGRG